MKKAKGSPLPFSFYLFSYYRLKMTDIPAACF
jgi:hypothetical protein